MSVPSSEIVRVYQRMQRDATGTLAMAERGDWRGVVDGAARYASEAARAMSMQPSDTPTQGDLQAQHHAAEAAMAIHARTVALLCARRSQLAHLLNGASTQDRVNGAYGVAVPMRKRPAPA